jgi:hypothetical protein
VIVPVDPPLSAACVDDDVRARGCAVDCSAVAPAKIAAPDRDLPPVFPGTLVRRGHIYGARTERCGRRLRRSPLAGRLAGHPLTVAMTDRALSPWCDTIQLNLTQPTEIQPGGPKQFPHRGQEAMLAHSVARQSGAVRGGARP